MDLRTGDSGRPGCDRGVTGGISVLVLMVIVLAVALVVGLVVVFGGGPADAAL